MNKNNETIDDFLHKMIELGASDLHMSHDKLISYRIDGEVEHVGPPIQGRFIFDLILPIIQKNSNIQRTYQETGDVDFAYSMEGGKYRFRVNLNKTRGHECVVFRIIPTTPIPLEELGLPSTVRSFVEHDHGMILITGPTGSGKSTTLASFVDFLNKTNKKKIVTFESPVEFIHKDKLCLVEQTEVGTDVPSFSEGMRGVLRRDPDVISLGELRDLDTMRSAMTASNTGHLVMTTVHTNNAPQTINRIIETYPGIERDQVRSELADNLIGVIGQRLYKKKGGGRIACYEVMVMDDEIAQLIRDFKIHEIHNAMRRKKSEGNIIMSDYYNEILEKGLIERNH